MLYEYPLSTRFGRVIPKSRIYEYSRANTQLQKKFVQEIEGINWAYKLSPDTLNIEANGDVKEIQVISIKLYSNQISEETLKAIDNAIPFPIIYELSFLDKIQTVASYKRLSEADPTKWVLGDYFWTGWLPMTTIRNQLPTAIDMSVLYEKILKSLLPINAREAEPLKDHVNRISQVDIKQKEIARLQTRIKKEKQFNRKVELNKQLKNLRCELEELLA